MYMRALQQHSPRESVTSDPELAEPSAKRRRLSAIGERQQQQQQEKKERQRQQALEGLQASTTCSDAEGGDLEEGGEESDTIPFAASEYEPFDPADPSDSDNPAMDDNANPSDPLDNIEYRNEKGHIVHNRAAMVGSSDAIVALKNSGVGPWEVVPQDIGYSSGENSIHEALCDVGIELKVTRLVFKPRNELIGVLFKMKM